MPRLPFVVLWFLFSLLPCTAAVPADIDVLRYDAELRTDIGNSRLHATVTIRFAVLAPQLAEVRFDASGLDIDEVRSGGLVLRWHTQEAALSVVPARTLTRGDTADVTIRYRARPSKGLRFFADDVTNQIHTLYHTYCWMPCRFTPADKAGLVLRLATPQGQAVVANGHLTEQTTVDSLVVTTWHAAPAPAYTFGFVTGRMDVVREKHNGVLLRYLSNDYTAEDIRRIFADVPAMMDFFADWSGVPYPASSYTYALVQMRAMQELNNLSVLSHIYGSIVLEEPREDWLIAHELSHEWWGNGVTCSDWSHFWLHEGLAQFMTALWKEHRFGRDEYDREIWMARRRYTSMIEAGRTRPLAYRSPVEEANAGGPLVYNKGALVLHLLRSTLGDSTFRQGLRLFTRRHMGGNADSDDLRRAMEEASGSDLAAFFDYWVYGGAAPVITVAEHREHDTLVLTITLNAPLPVAIPLRVTVETDSGRETEQMWLRDSVTTLRLPGNTGVKSVRMDDGGLLPVSVQTTNSNDMLLYQARHEPDVAGRADALLQLARRCAESSDAWCSSLHGYLADIAASDSSRLVRSVARQLLDQ